MLAIGNDPQFAACCECLGLPELVGDKRFATNADRVRHRDALVGLLGAAFRARDTGDWLASLGEHNVPAGPIQSVSDVLSDAFAEERELVRSLTHTTGAEVPTVANPVRFSETPVEYCCAPPQLGRAY